MRSETMSASQCQIDIDATTSNGCGIGGKTRADSPLDFSTKKKFSPEPLRIERRESSSVRPRSESATSGDTFPEDNPPESPCSRLRNILSMKSPMTSADMSETVLNLTKESPFPMLWCKSESPQMMSSNTSTNSNSCSPPLSEHHHPSAFSSSSSPRPAPDIPLSNGGSTPTLVRQTTGEGVENGGVGGSRNSSKNESSTISFPAWGSGVYSPSISPLINHAVPTRGGPLPFENSPTLFPHHMLVGAGGPAMQFHHGLSLPASSSSTGTKGRVTRPFKAYPKDPLSFTSPGLYGLSLGAAAPASGSPDAGIHQSNQAYAEFRKQMLSSSQFGKARRGGISHRHSPYPTMDSIDDHISDSSMMRANDSGSASDDGSSLTNGRNRHGKTEQQMKDEAYWERRRKNNEAAKRSRDARRAKEDEIAIRAAFLEQENLKLRFEVCALKNETAKLRCMLYSGS